MAWIWLTQFILYGIIAYALILVFTFLTRLFRRRSDVEAKRVSKQKKLFIAWLLAALSWTVSLILFAASDLRWTLLARTGGYSFTEKIIHASVYVIPMLVVGYTIYLIIKKDEQ